MARPPTVWLAAPLGLLSIAMAAACSFEPSGFASGDGDGGAVGDGGGSPDSDLVVSPDARVCTPLLGFVPSNFEECDASPVGGPATLDQTDGAYVIDTSAGTLTDPAAQVSNLTGAVLAQEGGPELQVWAVEQLTIDPGVQLDVVGQRALVIMATTTIVIDGELSVGARGSLSGPAGDREADCETGRGTAGKSQTADEVTGGSGGGGGAFAASGGNGAAIPDLEEDDPSPGGSAVGSLSLTPLRGGCAGGAGGIAAVSGGDGGGAGGALQLVAGTGIDIDGVVTSRGGGGGEVIGPSGGGGGGGSGGGILIETHALSVDGAITANGGGGGEGGRTSGVSDAGQNGRDGDGLRAGGGFGLSFGGNGGRGGATLEARGEGGSEGASSDEAAAGGGGGGGSVGVIRLRAIDGIDRSVFSVISPPPTVVE